MIINILNFNLLVLKFITECRNLLHIENFCRAPLIFDLQNILQIWYLNWLFMSSSLFFHDFGELFFHWEERSEHFLEEEDRKTCSCDRSTDQYITHRHRLPSSHLYTVNKLESQTKNRVQTILRSAISSSY